MADIESNINIDIDTSSALASIKQLQAQISAFHQSMAKSGAEANAVAAQMQQRLINTINATGKFSATMQNVQTTTESFTTALEKNQLSLGQYFKYAGASTKTFGKLFRGEFDTIEKVARERVKTLQTQYIKLGRDANGAMKAISVRPLALDMEDLGTKTAIAAQKTQLFNQLMQQGSTQMLNFGKNTQWAGRQLMVGFTIPLSIFGMAAGKEFMKIEEQMIRFKRVYGETFTSAGETDQMAQSVKDLATEFTKYGVAVEKTMSLAADAAAMGKQGADLLAQVADASRLAVLGGVDQQQALETTISLTNAFGISADQLAGKVNFLNAVENQTVTSIEDLTEAIPKAGPVIQQLGGNVEDLAFFLTAMKEGGINASEGANALKSGLASMINPTKEASQFLNEMGINLEGIVSQNAGNVKQTIIDFGVALDQLQPLQRAQAIEQLFGKFQFARMSTLFQNVIAEGSQASKVLSLTKQTTAELAVLAEREMKKIEDSPMYKFQKQVEQFQAAMAPVGEAFLKAVTPIIEWGTKILDGFNKMSDGAKQFWTILVAAVAGIGPVLLMTFGLIANGAANIIKMFLMMRKGFLGLGGQSTTLGQQTEYMTNEQLQAASVAASLNQVHTNLIQTFTSEKSAVAQLTAAYRQASAAAATVRSPMIPGSGSPKKYAKGVVTVPGTGTGDTVPAMLTPGEAVIPAEYAKRYGGLIGAMVSGTIPGYATGKKPYGEFNAYSNSVVYIDPALNKDMGTASKGANPADVASAIKSGGTAGMAPFLAEIARNMIGSGATNAQIKQLIANDPKLAEFGKQLATGIAKEVAKVPGQVMDEQFHALATKAASDISKSPKFKDSIGAAVDKTLNTVTGFEDTTVKRVSKTTGLIKGIGRRAVRSDTPFYENQSGLYSDVYGMLGGEGRPTGALSHITAKGTVTADELSSIGKLSSYAASAVDKVKNKLIEVTKIGGGGRVSMSSDSTPAQIREAAGAPTTASKALEDRGIVTSPRTRRSALDKVVAGEMREDLFKLNEYNKAKAKALKDGATEHDAIVAANRAKQLADTKISNKKFEIEQARLAEVEKKIQDKKNRDIAEDRAMGIDVTPHLTAATKKRKEEEAARKAKASNMPPMPPTQSSGTSAKTNAAMSWLKDKNPKVAKYLEDKATSLMEKLDLDGSVAERERQQAELGFQAREKLTAAQEEAAAQYLAEKKTMKNFSGVRADQVLSAEEMLALQKVDADETKQKIKDDKRNARMRRANAIGTAGMIASTAVGLASMIPGEIGQTAQSMAPTVMAVSAIAPMLAMLPGPLAIAGGAIAALVAGFISLQSAFDGAKDKAMDMVDALGSGEKAMNSLSEFAGTVTAGQEADKLRKDKFSQFQVVPGKKTFGESYLESEGGKKMLESVKTGLKTGDLASIKSMVTNQMMTAVATGALNAGQARSIVAQLGEELGDYNFSIDINSKLISLMGPNGEDLLKDPLGVRVKMIQETRGSMQASTDTLQGKNGGPSAATSAIQGVGQGLLNIGLAAGIGAGVGSIAGPVGTAIGAVAGTTVGIMTNWGNIVKSVENMGAAAGANVALNIMALQQQQELLDSLDKEYTSRIDAAKAAGDMAKADELSKKYVEDRAALLKENAKTVSQITASYSSADMATQGALGTSVDAAIKKKYEGTLMQDVAVNAGNLIGGAKMTGEQQYTMKVMLATGDLDPMQVTTLLNSFGQNEQQMKIIMSVYTNMGTAGGAEFTQILNMFKTSDGKADVTRQTKFIALYEKKGAQEQQELNDMFAMVQKVGDVVDLQMVLDVFMKDPQAGRDVMASVKKFKELQKQGPIKLTVVEEAYGVDVARIVGANWEYINSLDPDMQVTYTQTIATIYKTIGDPGFAGGVNNFLTEKGVKASNGEQAVFNPDNGLTANEQSWQDQYIANAAWKDTESAKAQLAANPPVIDTGGGGGGGGGPEASMLDDLLKKLKQVQMNALEVTKGWADSRTALDNLFPEGASNSPFNGIEQAMRRLGAGEPLINLIAGMDPEEFKKRKDELFTFDGDGNIAGFKSSLGSIGAALRSIALGEFNSKQQATIANFKDQSTALNKLIGLGFTYAEATNIVSDASTAAAIAGESNLDIIRQTTEQYKQATLAAKVYAAAQAAGEANAKVADTKGTIKFIQDNMGKLSNAVIEEMLKNSEFATLMMQPSLSPDAAAALQQQINDIENNSDLQIEIKKATIGGLEEIFNDGYNKAMEAFSAQEKSIEIKFTAQKDPFKDAIASSQQLIEDIRSQRGGLDDLEADIQRIGEKEKVINDAYSERYKALDKIQQANQRIINQQKSQLSVADALSRGDISAAARAAEEMRAQQAEEAANNQRKLLDAAREAEIAALTGTLGLTKEQIDQRILALKTQIFEIEEKAIEPAQYAITLLDRKEQIEKESLTILGKSKQEWENIKNKIDTAKTKSTEYKDAMGEALGVVSSILSYWTDIEKPKHTQYSVVIDKTIVVTPDYSNWSQPPANPDGSPGNAGRVNPPTQPSGTTRSSGTGAELSWIDSIKKGIWSWFTGYSTGGMVTGPGNGTSDSIAAKLSNGEYVINAAAVNTVGRPLLDAINGGKFNLPDMSQSKFEINSGSGKLSISTDADKATSMYNNTYNLSVNVKSDANPDEIARSVITQIKNVDAQRIRGNRF